MTDLLPCPWCAGTDVAVVKRDVEPQGDPWYGRKIEIFVECNSCGATKFNGYWHDGFSNDEEAAKSWNTRALSSQEGK